MAKLRGSLKLWTALFIVVLILVLSVGSFFGWWDTGVEVGMFPFVHWMGWFGGGFLAISVPLYSVLKRRFNVRSPSMVTFHGFGNLIAFGLISVHFAHNLSRAPYLDSGLAMFLILTTIGVAGFVAGFGLVPKYETKFGFIHIGLALSIITILPIHVLHTLGVLITPI